MIIRIKNYIYIIFGFIFLGLGMFGIILPLLPTTPLLLLASVCFVRGSKKFEVWFKGTNLYKKHLEEFVKNRAMTKRQKMTILFFADCMIAIPFILLDNFLIRVLLILIVGYKYYYFFCKINTIKTS
ncbi:YbaN family protein [Metabacillus bambusae]|uniref:YbaN family protein n=1 Tax=Metabacillus bambusae TaxID=2795218 RepID=A0ABS3MX27_9BACI|nr:YbaN family protein [Metabacillus bambusae]MBO1510233.1 YbaN family protein [Metabacillus bambusae]